jgi:hypothetical protein
MFRLLGKREVLGTRVLGAAVAVGGAALAAGGFLWVYPGDYDGGLAFYAELTFLVVVIVGVFSYNGPNSAETGRPWRWLALPAAVLAVTFSVSLLPSDLTLQFRTDETSLNRLRPLVAQMTEGSSTGCVPSDNRLPSVTGLGRVSDVCSGQGWVTFDSATSNYQVIYDPGAQAPWVCVLHLDGRWWEADDIPGGMPCPGGFLYVPSG